MLTKKNHLKSPPNIKARLSTPGTRHGGVLQTSYSIKGNGITALRECNTGKLLLFLISCVGVKWPHMTFSCSEGLDIGDPLGFVIGHGHA